MKRLTCSFIGILCAIAALICIGVSGDFVSVNPETSTAWWWFALAAAGYTITSILALVRIRELRPARL